MTSSIINQPSRERITGESWEFEKHFLRASGLSPASKSTYRRALRTLADWTKTYHHSYDGASLPLSPTHLTTEVVLKFRDWLGLNKASGTQAAYCTAIVQYLYYLDTVDELPGQVQLGKLRQELAGNSRPRSQANALNDEVRQGALERIVSYYDRLALPIEGTQFSQRLILLRDRALVRLLHETGISLGQLCSLNRHDVDDGNVTVSLNNHDKLTRSVSGLAQRYIQAYLTERTDSTVALFVAHSRNASGKRLSRTSVGKVIKRAVEELGLPRGISSQDFRIAYEQRSKAAQQHKISTSTDVTRIFSQIRNEIQLSSLAKDFQDIALYDLHEAERSFNGGAFKATIVLSGSVLEALMLGTLLRDDVIQSIKKSSDPPASIKRLGLKHPELAHRVAERLTFEDYKNAILHLIPHLQRLQVENIQNYRNAIHPWLAISDPIVFASTEKARTRALHYLTSLDLLSHNILQWNPEQP